MENLGIGVRWEEHVAQKMRPQERQWCFRTKNENLPLQLKHSVTPSSGTHAGAMTMLPRRTLMERRSRGQSCKPRRGDGLGPAVPGTDPENDASMSPYEMLDAESSYTIRLFTTEIPGPGTTSWIVRSGGGCTSYGADDGDTSGADRDILREHATIASMSPYTESSASRRDAPATQER